MSYLRMGCIGAVVAGAVVLSIGLYKHKHVPAKVPAPVVKVEQPKVIRAPVIIAKPVERVAPVKRHRQPGIKRRAVQAAPAAVEHCNFVHRCVTIDPASGMAIKEPRYVAKD